MFFRSNNRVADRGEKMAKWEFDIQKFVKTAKQLGLKVEFNSERPGMFIVDEDGNEKEVTMEDIFPELRELEDEGENGQ
jgi:hypothetical protein